MEFEYFDGDARCLGVLELPDPVRFPGPRPGVIAVHEAWGIGKAVRTRARMLADLGYVALAADIFGDGHIPADPPAAFKLIGEFLGDRPRLRTRAAAAVVALKAHPGCDGRIAAIGYCFGGSTVLELARGGTPDVLGVVSFHGGLETPTPAKPGAVTAKILVCHGAEDTLVTQAHLTAFLQEMAGAGADCQTIAYTGAMHSFTNADADGTLMPTIIHHARTDVRSWSAMRQFFDTEIFG